MRILLSWLPDIWGTAADYQAGVTNYDAQKVKYAAQLKRRLLDNQISQQFYDNQMASIRDGLTDPSDAAWAEFVTQVETEAKNLPSTVQNGVQAVAQWTGETVGKVGSGIGGGLIKGWFGGNAFFTVGLIVAIVAAVFLWKPVLKPLFSKIKIIPV